MIRTILYSIIEMGLGISGWIQYGRNHDAPLHPGRVFWIEPSEINHKPVSKPPSMRFPPTLVAGGEWDQTLTPITDDIVYESFQARFEEGVAWEETGYVEFLGTDQTEHGRRSVEEALDRCAQLDDLYEYIDEQGFQSQTELERDDGLIEGLSGSVRPPAYREVAVDVTRDGEFVWHAGMHRLVIAQLVDVDEIPVRINTRHEEWQEIRDQAWRTGESAHANHPDVEVLL